MQRLEETNIWVGGREAVSLRHDPAWAVVNTSKSVHSEILGRMNQDNPNYLVFEDDNFLSINWVDGNSNMFEWTGVPVFIKSLDFIDKWDKHRDVLINCDKGQSRSPTVALLYLAKRIHLIPDESFEDAKEVFQTIYPSYAPNGIADYVSNNWDQII